jgi:hypothetical protein
MPFHLLDGGQSSGAKLFAIKADEPLFRGTEDDGVVAAPTVWIAVLYLCLRGKSSVLLQQFNDYRVAFPDGLANEFVRQNAGCAFGSEDAASGVNRAIDRQTVTLTDNEIILAVAGSSVDRTGSLLERDMVTKKAYGIAIEKWVAEDEAFKPDAGKAREDGFIPAEGVRDLI